MNWNEKQGNKKSCIFPFTFHKENMVSDKIYTKTSYHATTPWLFGLRRKPSQIFPGTKNNTNDRLPSWKELAAVVKDERNHLRNRGSKPGAQRSYLHKIMYERNIPPLPQLIFSTKNPTFFNREIFLKMGENLSWKKSMWKKSMSPCQNLSPPTLLSPPIRLVPPFTSPNQWKSIT